MGDEELRKVISEAMATGQLTISVGGIPVQASDTAATPPWEEIPPTWDSRGLSDQRNWLGLHMVKGVEELRSKLARDEPTQLLAKLLPIWYGRIDIDTNLTDEQEHSLRENNTHWFMTMSRVGDHNAAGVQMFQKFDAPYLVNGNPTYTWGRGAQNNLNQKLSYVVPRCAIVYCGANYKPDVVAWPSLALKFAEEQQYIQAAKPLYPNRSR